MLRGDIKLGHQIGAGRLHIGGVRMPPVFKALATIAVWVLFVVGLFALVTAFARLTGAGMGFSSSPELSLMYAYFGFGISGLFLSVLAMKLRKGLE